MDGPKPHKQNWQMSSVQFTCVAFHEGWTILTSHKTSLASATLSGTLECQRPYHKTQPLSETTPHHTEHCLGGKGKTPLPTVLHKIPNEPHVPFSPLPKRAKQHKSRQKEVRENIARTEWGLLCDGLLTTMGLLYQEGWKGGEGRTDRRCTGNCCYPPLPVQKAEQCHMKQQSSELN